jgi:hypothetical protein
VKDEKPTDLQRSKNITGAGNSQNGEKGGKSCIRRP